jgi:putative phosphoribosyl transferase
MHEEFAFGSIASGGIRYINDAIVRTLGLSRFIVDHVIEREEAELERRERLYRGDRPAPDLRNKTVIIVDDGLATGSTMRAAVRAVHTQAPKKIIAATPVCARETQQALGHEVDTWCICSITPEPFYAVGQWYRDFSQTTDAEVRDLLEMNQQGIKEASVHKVTLG